MKRMNVDAAKEARLWITRVIFPTIMVSYIVFRSNSDIRDAIMRSFRGVGQRFSTKGD